MSRISTLFASCGRVPVATIAIAAGVAFGFGLLASTDTGDRGRVITVQEGNQEGGWADMDQEEMAEMMAMLGAPGEAHEGLKVFVGSWDTTMESLGEGMEAFNSTGSATFEPVMGGRFIKQDFKGSFMGAPMNGVGLSGFNNASKQYEGVWYDSMSTALFVVKGEKTDTGWVYEGEETDPMSGEKFGFRHVITMNGKDTWAFTMQYPPEVAAAMGVQGEEGAKWVDSFRISYTRKGAGNGMGGNGGGGGNAKPAPEGEPQMSFNHPHMTLNF